MEVGDIWEMLEGPAPWASIVVKVVTVLVVFVERYPRGHLYQLPVLVAIYAPSADNNASAFSILVEL